MNKVLKYLLLLPLIGLIGGCAKFLDVRPDNSSINPSTVEDFEMVLNHVTLASPNFFLADLASDDILLDVSQVNLGGGGLSSINTYMWKKDIWGNAEDDFMYNHCYEVILQMNILLNKIDKVSGGTPGRKEILIAQAKINRAYYYLQLVNLYGPSYRSSSAGEDLAVPLVLQPDATESPKRATVQEIYNQVLTDLNDALKSPALPDFGVDIIHPGKAAAFALLARAYLYMADFDKALINAENVLKLKRSLLDYNAGEKFITLEEQQSNQEIILARVCLESTFYVSFGQKTPYCSTALLKLFDSEDLRFQNNFTFEGGLFAFNTYVNDAYNHSLPFNYSVGVPEMMLIKAECLARDAKVEDALTVINELREKRFEVSNPIKLTAVSDILSIVLEERRRELFYKGGLRLFDLKRLALEGRFKETLERRSTLNNSVTATLPAGSGRYLFPFAPKIINGNPSIIQNERN